tara:strand:+ start:349 stop:1533 length:1185 start_codon:yes stop_codon:yes gene_type:complete
MKSTINNNLKKYLPLSVPCLSGNEMQYVEECIKTEWVSSAGKFVDLFEEKVAEFTGSKYAVACVNGTSALQVSLRLAGVSENDEVIVPTITFIAPVNAIIYNNARPIFMDSDDFYNIDSQKTCDFINNETVFKKGSTFNKKTGRRISGIIPVHVWGNACNLEKLYQLCKERNIAIVEDASESLGSYYINDTFKNKFTGTIGKIGCISFNGNKIITSGGGGIILLDDEKLYGRAKYLTTQAKNDPIYFVHDEIGYNFRLTNVQAAIGLAQLEQLPRFLKVKKDINKGYKALIKNNENFRIANTPSYSQNNHWLNILQIRNVSEKMNVDKLMHSLEEKGIQTRPVWKLNHLQAPFKSCQSYKIKKAINLINSSLCLPSSVNLNNDDLLRIVESLNE